MVSKWGREERRRRKAEAALQISEFDREALEQLKPVRLHVGGYEFREGPRAVACLALYHAIEKWAEMVTGDPEYYWQTRNGTD